VIFHTQVAGILACCQPAPSTDRVTLHRTRRFFPVSGLVITSIY